MVPSPGRWRLRCLACVISAACMLEGGVGSHHSLGWQQNFYPLQRVRSRGHVTAIFGGLFGGGQQVAPSTGAGAVQESDKPRQLPDSAPKLPKVRKDLFFSSLRIENLVINHLDMDPAKLFDGFFNGELPGQFQTAIKTALKDGVQYMEVNYPPLPNMEELEFGTVLNQKYNKELARRLRLEDYEVKSNSVFYSNLDAASRLADAVNRRTFVVSFANGRTPPSTIALSKKVILASASAGCDEATPQDLIVVLSPTVQEQVRQEESEVCACRSLKKEIDRPLEVQWTRARQIAKKGTPVVALNPAFSQSYEIGQSASWELGYLFKRVTKGFVYRAYPGPYKAYLDTPDGSPPILIEVYKERPLLRDVSALVRSESNKRFGLKNDRFMTMRL